MKILKHIFILFVCIGSVANAQVLEEDLEKRLKKQRRDSLDGWKLGGAVEFNGSNVALINWAAGGKNSLSFNGGIDLYANFKKDSATWDNDFAVDYGLMKQGESGWLKTDDRIEVNSQYGLRTSKSWYYSILLNFRTQMTEGFNYPNDSVKISNFMAPGYLLGATGMTVKPNDKFQAFIAPLTGKLTFVQDQILADSGAYGVEPAKFDLTTGMKIADGKNFRAELGGYIRSRFKTKFTDNIDFLTKLDLFSNYLNNPQNIDVNWETSIKVRLWKIITISFFSHLIYDDDIDITVYDDNGNITGVGPRVQFRHLTGLGLSWEFDRLPKN